MRVGTAVITGGHPLKTISISRARLAAGVLGLTLLASPAMAQGMTGSSATPITAEVSSPRLYVIDCGQLIYNRPESYGLTRDEVANSNMSVACFVVVHPKGVLLYDTGLSDALVGRPFYENPQAGYQTLKTSTLVGKLADIGLKPADITYLALSHSHWDHVGNANLFARSTWLTSRAGYDGMFRVLNPPAYDHFDKLKDAKKIIFEGDHDVFGDGSVILKQTPGHMPGHQSLYVKLAQTGGVLVAGDLYHYQEELDKGRMPPEELKSETPRSRQAMETFVRDTHSQIWIPHSIAFFAAARQSPAWYE
jgi:glyoxylase-like metal-dependent hydrolase (beta-lactamase superfamily II)